MALHVVLLDLDHEAGAYEGDGDDEEDEARHLLHQDVLRAEHAHVRDEEEVARAALRIIVLGQISAPFPPAVSHRLLLSCLTAAID